MTTCTKVSYPSPGAAEYGLRVFLRKHPERDERDIHPCAKCRSWHLTSGDGYLKRHHPERRPIANPKQAAKSARAKGTKPFAADTM